MSLGRSRVIELLALVGLAFGGASCGETNSADVPQSEVYSRYILEYESGSKVIRMTAVFSREGAAGRNLSLGHGAQLLTEEGTVFREQYAPVGREMIYRHEFSDISSGVLVRPFVLLYRNSEDRMFRNALTFKGTLDFSSEVSGLVSRSSDLTVNWIADAPIGPNERVELRLLRNVGPRPVLEVFGEAADQLKGSFVVPAEELGRMTSGRATLQLCRRSVSALEQAEKAGGIATVIFCSKRAVIDLID